MTRGADGTAENPRTQSRGFRLASFWGLHEAARLLKDFATNLPAQAISAFAALIGLLLIARHLPPTELGTLAISQTLVNLGWIVCAQWLTASILRELPMYRRTGDLATFRRTLWRGLGLVVAAFAAFAAVVVLGSLVSGAIAGNLVFILGAAAGLIVQNIATTLFLANTRPRLYSLGELIGRTGGIALGVKLVVDGHGVHGFLFGLGAVSGAVGVIGLVLAWPRKADEGRASVSAPPIRSWLAYGGPVTISASVMWGFLFIDRYLLAALKSTGDVGIYTIGSVIGERSIMIPALALYSVARPLLFTAFEHKGQEAVERLMHVYTRLLLILMAPILAFVTVTSGPLIRLLTTGYFPQFYARAIPVAPVIALGTFFIPLAMIGNTGLLVARKTRLFLFGSGSALLSNVVANLLLIPPFGLMGAAIATVIGSVTFLLVLGIFANRYAMRQFPFGTLLRVGVAAGAGLGVALALMPLGGSDLVKIAIVAGAGGPVYAVVLFLAERSGWPASLSGRERARPK